MVVEGFKNKTIREKLSYLTELADFRLALERNVRDAEATGPDKPLRVLYLIDANLLHLYFAPIKNANNVSAFSFAKQPRNLEAAMAIITAEFLFHGKLPGRGKFPLYIDPGHMIEFSKKVIDQTETMLAAAKKVDVAKKRQLRKDIDVLRGEIVKVSGNSKELRKLYDTKLQELFADYSFEPEAAPQMLRELIRGKDLVRPLEFAPYIDRGLVRKPDANAVNHWLEMLKTHRRPWETVDEKSDNRKRDAECLARLFSINKDLQQRKVSAQLVLVTSNKSMHAAVRAANLPRSYIRHPHQYIPLNNIRDLDNRVASARGTHAISHAIDTLLALRPPDEDSPVGFARQVCHRGSNLDVWLNPRKGEIREEDKDLRDYQKRKAKALTKAYFAPLLQENLGFSAQAVSEIWLKLLRNAEHLNSRHIVAHYSTWLFGLLDEMEKVSEQTRDGLSELYEQDQLVLASNLTRQHLELVLCSALMEAPKTSRRWAILGTGISVTTGPEPAEIEAASWQLVEDFCQDDRRTFVSPVNKLCELKNPVEQIALACAIISLQIGSWTTAEQLADIASALAGQSEKEGAKLIKARAQLVANMARRSIALDAEDASAAAAFDDADKETLSLASLRRSLEQEGYYIDAALCATESAWLTCTKLIGCTLRGSKEDLDAIKRRGATWVENISQDAMTAVNLANRGTAHSYSDFTGADPREILSARASIALLYAALFANQNKIDVPVVAQALLPHAVTWIKNVINRISDPDDILLFRHMLILAEQRHIVLKVELIKPTPHDAEAHFRRIEHGQAAHFRAEIDFMRKVFDLEAVKDPAQED